MKETFTIIINENSFDVVCDPGRSLLDVLREDLRLTGTKRGCDIGVCGSCTVLIGERPKRACAVKIQDVARRLSLVARNQEPVARRLSFVARENDLTDGIHQITTIEGLSKDGKLHPIQRAFIDCGAIQCGFCTPGMVLAAKALLDENPHPTRDEIKKALANNLCRCTGYQQIFEAVEQAAKKA